MRDFTANFVNSMTGANLHCVWVRVRDGERDRLVSSWVDPASATSKTTSSRNVRNRSTYDFFCDAEGNESGRLDAEDPYYVLSPRS